MMLSWLGSELHPPDETRFESARCPFRRTRTPLNRSAFSRNIPLFVAFRVLFNARWALPDSGRLVCRLRAEHRAIRASQRGMGGHDCRSRGAVGCVSRPTRPTEDGHPRGAAVMVVEMAVFSLAPRGNRRSLSPLFSLNRILSGAAEASASGADEDSGLRFARRGWPRRRMAARS